MLFLSAILFLGTAHLISLSLYLFEGDPGAGIGLV